MVGRAGVGKVAGGAVAGGRGAKAGGRGGGGNSGVTILIASGIGKSSSSKFALGEYLK